MVAKGTGKRRPVATTRCMRDARGVPDRGSSLGAPLAGSRRADLCCAPRMRIIEVPPHRRSGTKHVMRGSYLTDVSPTRHAWVTTSGRVSRRPFTSAADTWHTAGQRAARLARTVRSSAPVWGRHHEGLPRARPCRGSRARRTTFGAPVLRLFAPVAVGCRHASHRSLWRGGQPELRYATAHKVLLRRRRAALWPCHRSPLSFPLLHLRVRSPSSHSHRPPLPSSLPIA